MAGITLEIAEAQLSNWLAANEAVALNQSYSINNRSLTRADAGTIQSQIDYWDMKCNSLGRRSGGITVRNLVPE